jgi:hypothetical protein
MSLAELTKRSFMRRKPLARPIEFLVLSGELRAEGAIGLKALPAIDRNVAKALRAIVQQKGLDVTGRLTKERNPRSLWPITALELRLPLEVDLEFPEIAVPRHKPRDATE